ncbi:uncharacterized protein RSE6_11245 [Rhynchosporium secalis]|uniref:Uncharacterized protein n=1 Tax=Rhynchosporium secalis TaxID=38038 RepID=A0A1E1MMH8_RHYSE|nr:uncharacterized protein RSE6_11245 [Rhynchosporium secalis]
MAKIVMRIHHAVGPSVLLVLVLALLPEFDVRLDLGDVYTTTAQLELLPWVQEAMGKFAGARGSEHGWVSQRDQL